MQVSLLFTLSLHFISSLLFTFSRSFIFPQSFIISRSFTFPLLFTFSLSYPSHCIHPCPFFPATLPRSMTNHDDATTAKDTGRILTGGALSRRKHYETTSRWIAEKRDELYSAVPINHIVQLAFHTTPTLLAGFENIDVVIRAVSAQYQSDLFGDWQKFCRALNAEQRSWALFGMEIEFNIRMDLMCDRRSTVFRSGMHFKLGGTG